MLEKRRLSGSVLAQSTTVTNYYGYYGYYPYTTTHSGGVKSASTTKGTPKGAASPKARPAKGGG